MKAVIISDSNGNVLIRVLHRKNGEYEVEKRRDVSHVNIEIRDEGWNKTYFPGGANNT